MVREGHRLLWGFVAPPKEMTEEGRDVFVNALVWIHKFDGHPQTVFAGLHTRDVVSRVLKSPYVDKRNLNRWFPQELIAKTEGDKEKIQEHFAGRTSYIHVPTGSGQLHVDEEAERLQTPNNEVASLAKWIKMLEVQPTEDKQIAARRVDVALRLLRRYTGQRFRKNAKQWREWLEQIEGRLVFRDEQGYRFIAQQNQSAEEKTKEKFLNQYAPQEAELTDISPVLFDCGLVSLHLIDGVAHCYRGRKVTLVIRARVKQDWHLYSATESSGTNVPKSIRCVRPPAVREGS